MKIKKKSLSKRSVSEMVAYVLLIVIAISVSIMVYAYLKAYIWKNTEKCPDGVSLIIEDYSCNNTAKILNLTLKNQGLHNINGVILLGNNGSRRGIPLGQNEGRIIFEEELNTSMNANFIIDYSKHNTINEVQLKPVQEGRNMIICEEAIFSQEIKGC